MANTQRVVLFDGSSGQSSAATSSVVAFIGDAADRISVSWRTDTTAASRLTFEVNDDDGFDSALAEASWQQYYATAGGQTGMVSNITSGPRWLRALRNSNESLSVVVATWQNRAH